MEERSFSWKVDNPGELAPMFPLQVHLVGPSIPHVLFVKGDKQSGRTGIWLAWQLGMPTQSDCLYKNSCWLEEGTSRKERSCGCTVDNAGELAPTFPLQVHHFGPHTPSITCWELASTAARHAHAGCAPPLRALREGW